MAALVFKRRIHPWRHPASASPPQDERGTATPPFIFLVSLSSRSVKLYSTVSFVSLFVHQAPLITSGFTEIKPLRPWGGGCQGWAGVVLIHQPSWRPYGGRTPPALTSVQLGLQPKQQQQQQLPFVPRHAARIPMKEDAARPRPPPPRRRRPRLLIGSVQIPSEVEEGV